MKTLDELLRELKVDRIYEERAQMNARRLASLPEREAEHARVQSLRDNYRPPKPALSGAPGAKPKVKRAPRRIVRAETGPRELDFEVPPDLDLLPPEVVPEFFR